MNILESEMPVICISAATLNDDWQKYQKAGMNAFLPKPFTEEMLLTTILSVIKDYSPVTRADHESEKEIRSVGHDKINLNNLYHISGGDEQFVKQMLLSFIDSTTRGLNDMKDSVKSGQLDSVADLAHKMSPPSRHIGALDLCNLLKKIEYSTQKKVEPGALQVLAREALLEFEAVSGLIKEHIAKIS
jgi:HPt (histidine-containing phosphotransfer) domain-containing protein